MNNLSTIRDSLSIDFGTSTTLVALPGLEPRILPIGKEGGNYWLPSVVAIDKEQNFLVGEDADKGALANQFRSPKRAITKNQDFVVNGNGNEVQADEIIKKIISEVKNRCEDLGFKGINQVRLSCPAMWVGEQRKRLVKIVSEAGFTSDIDSVLDEPISASIAWWWSRFSQGLKIEEKKRAIIFDFGGGTLDVAVVDIYPRPGMPELTVLAARGIDNAGDDLDEKLALHIIERLRKERNYDLGTQSQNQLIEIGIRLAARECKEILSKVEETRFQVDPKIASVPVLNITRVELNDVFADQMKSALNCVDAALREARMKAGDNLTGPEIARIPRTELGKEIDFVVLAGGMSQIPKVSEDLQSMMPKAQVEFAAFDAKASTSAIALGIANLNEFAELNIHRPNFNIVASYQTKDGLEKRFVIYPAFTPLYSQDQIIRGESSLGFHEEWVPEEEPANGTINLSLESIGGRKLSLRNYDSNQNVPLIFKADRLSSIQIKIYVSGRILISDRTRQFVARVREWPHIRWMSSIDHSKFALKLELPPENNDSNPNSDWWRLK